MDSPGISDVRINYNWDSGRRLTQSQKFVYEQMFSDVTQHYADKDQLFRRT